MSMECERAVALDEIKILPRKRPVRDTTGLVESMRESGQLEPIGLTPDLTLIFGAHRIAAARVLGWSTVRASILDIDEPHRELAEIDENLLHNELTTLERGEHLARRKELYEELHPETKHGGAPGAGQGRGKRGPSREIESITLEAVPSFAEDTSAKTGVSAPVIRREIHIAKNISGDIRDSLRNTPVANCKEELLALAALKDPEKQREALALVANGSAKNIRQATGKPPAKNDGHKRPPCANAVSIAISDLRRLEARCDDLTSLCNTRLDLLRLASIRAAAGEIRDAVRSFRTGGKG